MSSYDSFAKQYSDSQGESGDYFHQTQVDPYVYKIIGNVKGKFIYDIGCGNGYMARNFAKNGAKVFASDLSSELVKIAKEKSTGLNIEYFVNNALDFSNLKSRKFDVITMNMVIQYFDNKNLDMLFKNISKHLNKGGIFVFSTDHFFRPGMPYSYWYKGVVDGNERLFIKVTNYLESEYKEVESKWDNSTKLKIYKRPLSILVNTLSKNGLLTKEIYEPDSVGFAKDYSEELQKTHHIPTFIIFGAIKV